MNLINKLKCWMGLHDFKQYTGTYETKDYSDGRTQETELHEICFNCINCPSFKKDYYVRSYPKNKKNGHLFGTKIYHIKKGDNMTESLKQKLFRHGCPEPNRIEVKPEYEHWSYYPTAQGKVFMKNSFLLFIIFILLGDLYLNSHNKSIANKIRKEYSRITCEVEGLAQINNTNKKIEEIINLEARILALEKYCLNKYE